MQDNNNIDLPFDDFLPSRWRNDADDFLRNSKHHTTSKPPATASKERMWSDRSLNTGETHPMDDEYNSEEENVRKMKQQQQQRVSHNKIKPPPPHQNVIPTSHQPPPPARREAIKEQPSLGRHLNHTPSIVMGGMGSSSHSGLASIAEEDSSESEASATNSPVINERDQEFLENIKSPGGVLVAAGKQRRGSLIQSNTVANTNTEQSRKQAWLHKPAWARRVSLGGAVPHTPLSDTDSDDQSHDKKKEKSNRGLLDTLLGLGDSNKDVSKSPGAEDKSVESAGLNLRGDLRQSLLKMNSVMNKSAMFSMTPEELQVREMRPWRKQSQLRSAKLSMQAAALAVQAELGDEEDSDADDKSEVDSVCYQIPDEFQRTPKPEQKNGLSDFDDLWSPSGGGGSTPGGPENPFKKDVRAVTQTNTTPTEKSNKAPPKETRKKKSEASSDPPGKEKSSTKDAGESGHSRETKQRKKEKQKAIKQDQTSSSDQIVAPQSVSNVDEELEDLFALMKQSKDKDATNKDEQKSRADVEPKQTGDKAKKSPKKMPLKEEAAEPKGHQEASQVPGSNAVAISDPKIPPKKYKREEDPKLRDIIIDTDDSSDLSSLSGHFGNTRSEPPAEIASEKKPVRGASSAKENNDSSDKHRRRRMSLGAMETGLKVKEARDKHRRMSMGVPQTSSEDKSGRSLEKSRRKSLGIDEKEAEIKKDKKKSKKSRRSSLLEAPKVDTKQKASRRGSIDAERNEPETKDDSKRSKRSRRLSLEAPKAGSEPKLDRRSAMARSRSRSESAFQISSPVAKEDRPSPLTRLAPPKADSLPRLDRRAAMARARSHSESAFQVSSVSREAKELSLSSKEARRMSLAAPKSGSEPRMDRRAAMARARSRSESAFQVSPREREPRVLSPSGKSKSLTKADVESRPWDARDSHLNPLVNTSLTARDTRSRSSLEDLTSKDERSRDESRSKKKKKKKEKKEKKKSKEKTDDSSSRRSRTERFEFLPREPSFQASPSKRSLMAGQVPLPFLDLPPSPRVEYEGDRKLKLEKTRRTSLGVNVDGEKERSRDEKKKSRKKDKEGRSSSGRTLDDSEKRYSRERRHSISVSSSRPREAEPEVIRKDREGKSKKREKKKRSSSLPSEERSNDELASRRSGSGRDVGARPAPLRSRSGSARSLFSSGSTSGGSQSERRHVCKKT